MKNEKTPTPGIAWRNAAVRGYLACWLLGAYPLFKIIEANDIWSGLFAVFAAHLVVIPTIWLTADMAANEQRGS